MSTIYLTLDDHTAYSALQAKVCISPGVKDIGTDYEGNSEWALAALGSVERISGAERH